MTEKKHLKYTDSIFTYLLMSCLLQYYIWWCVLIKKWDKKKEKNREKIAGSEESPWRWGSPTGGDGGSLFPVSFAGTGIVPRPHLIDIANLIWSNLITD